MTEEEEHHEETPPSEEAKMIDEHEAEQYATMTEEELNDAWNESLYLDAPEENVYGDEEEFMHEEEDAFTYEEEGQPYFGDDHWRV